MNLKEVPQAVTAVPVENDDSQWIKGDEKVFEKEVRQQKAKSQTEWGYRSGQTSNAVLTYQGRNPNVLDQPQSRREIEILRGTGGNPMRPLWIGGMLILARRVAAGSEVYVQGCWLDWDAVRAWMEEIIGDLLPRARLEPVTDRGAGDGERMLAALPVRLIPNETPAPGAGGLSPVLFSLLVAWACVLVGAGAVGVLLHGVVSLSERRGAFASAVTHELRTPLTTFRMYSEMLERNMIPDEAKRKDYLRTLCTESERLSHLVENVLSYARLEKGRAAGRVEEIEAGDLLNRFADRLAQRAGLAGMELVLDDGGNASGVKVRADVSAVDQILFNLVDNACKYAASAPDRRIRLGAERQGSRVFLLVRDHGPGVPVSAARKLFRPFSKSARDAANSAPGVGLGLALSRRLARSMGGDLRLDTDVRDGACFVLDLPAA